MSPYLGIQKFNLNNKKNNEIIVNMVNIDRKFDRKQGIHYMRGGTSECHF